MGALISGRRLFDITGGWNGNHPMGVPVFVVSHAVPDGWPRRDARFTFVTDGVESAVARAKATAGARAVAVASANVAQQCLKAGLIDEIRVDLVPVLLGEGIRFFDSLGGNQGGRGPRWIARSLNGQVPARVRPISLLAWCLWLVSIGSSSIALTYNATHSLPAALPASRALAPAGRRLRLLGDSPPSAPSSPGRALRTPSGGS